MVRTATCWSFLGLVLTGLFYTGYLIAASDRPAMEAEYPPLLERMPDYPGQPLEFADEAARQTIEGNARRPGGTVAENGTSNSPKGRNGVATTIYMSYSPAA